MQRALRDVFGTLEEDPRAEQRRRILAASGLKPDGTPIKKAAEPEMVEEDVDEQASAPADNSEATVATSSAALATTAGHVPADTAVPSSNSAASSAAAPPAPAVPAGRRRRVKVTPVFVRAGMTVMAPWRGSFWRAEVLRVFLDHSLVADSVRAEERGEPATSPWRVDVRFESDESVEKGIFVTALKHTMPEYHTIGVSPADEARGRLIGTEMLRRSELAQSEVADWKELLWAENECFGKLVGGVFHREFANTEREEAEKRNRLRQDESGEWKVIVAAAAVGVAEAHVHERERLAREEAAKAQAEAEERARALRQARLDAFVVAAQRCLRQRAAVYARDLHVDRILADIAAHASKACQTEPPIAIDDRSAERVRVDDDERCVADVTNDEMHVMQEDVVGEASPRIAHYPPQTRGRWKSWAESPKPPFRTTALHPGIPPVPDPLPPAKSRNTSPSLRGRSRSRSRSASSTASPGRRYRRTGTPPPRVLPGSAYSPMDRSRDVTPTRTPHDVTPIRSQTPVETSYVRTSSAAQSDRSHGFSTLRSTPAQHNSSHLARMHSDPHATRGFTPAKSSPVPRKYAQVAPRYQNESLLRPSSLASYLRMASARRPDAQ